MTTANELGTLVAHLTRDAYSYSRYGEKAWKASCVMLANRHYTKRQIEAIMRSKWTRWAADASDKEKPTSSDLKRFLDDPRNAITDWKVKQLVNGG